MPRVLRWILLAVVALAGLAAILLAGAIAFSAPTPPPPLEAGDAIPGFRDWTLAELPERRRVAARDGAPLLYRAYPGDERRLAVLLHGSTSSSTSMHQVAKALSAAGIAVASLDMRGHGGSGARSGDVAYVGQIDDDIADVMRALARPSGGKAVLIGFSAGGGVALRIAGSAQGRAFDGYVLMAPYLGHGAPPNKPYGGGWVDAAVPRIVALTLLDNAGLAWFQHLPVIAYATGAKPSVERAPIYSYRLTVSLNPGFAWQDAVRRTARPVRVIAGGADELFTAEAYAPALAPLNVRFAVTILPELKHLDLIARPEAYAAIVAATAELLR